jgi:hypothetical protein
MELCGFRGGFTFSDESSKDTRVFHVRNVKRVYVDVKRRELCIVVADEPSPVRIGAQNEEKLTRWWKNVTRHIEDEDNAVERVLIDICRAKHDTCDEICKHLGVLDQIDSALQDISASVCGVSSSLDNLERPSATKKRKV